MTQPKHDGDTDSTVANDRWLVLVVLNVALLAVSIDNTILNVALPRLVRDLGASNSELQWIVDGYVIAFAGLLLTGGALGDRFGRRRALVVGLLLFGFGSGAAAMVGSPQGLIATRAVMGVGGALIMPATLSVLTAVFPPAERGRAIGIWAAVSALGIVIGPLAGGALLEHFWWGSVFLVNVPVVLLATVAALRFVPESRDPRQTPLDPIGTALSSAGLVAGLYAIIEAPSHGWTAASTLVIGGAGVVLVATFLWWERRTDHPMLDLTVFRNPRFSAASGSVTIVFFALMGSMFFMTQFLQFVLGYGTLAAGVRMLPFAAGLMLAAPNSAKLVRRFGTTRVVAAGLGLVATGLFVLSTATVDSGYGRLFVMMVVMSVGMGLAMPPATESIMNSLPVAKAGVGSAVNDTTRQVGGALGVAVLGSLMASRYRDAIVDSPSVGVLPAEAAEVASRSVGAAIAVADRLPPELGDALRAEAFAGFVDAVSTTALVGGAVALVGVAVALRFLPSRDIVETVDDPIAALEGPPAGATQ